MRIWHLMAAVLAIGVAATLMVRAPELALIILIDGLLVYCAAILLRWERRHQDVSRRAARQRAPPRHFGERLILWGDTVAVVLLLAFYAIVVSGFVVSAL